MTHWTASSRIPRPRVALDGLESTRGPAAARFGGTGRPAGSECIAGRAVIDCLRADALKVQCCWNAQEALRPNQLCLGWVHGTSRSPSLRKCSSLMTMCCVARTRNGIHQASCTQLKFDRAWRIRAEIEVVIVAAGRVIRDLAIASTQTFSFHIIEEGTTIEMKVHTF